MASEARSLQLETIYRHGVQHFHRCLSQDRCIVPSKGVYLFETHRDEDEIGFSLLMPLYVQAR